MIEAESEIKFFKTNVSHTHTKSQITDFPSSMVNPNSITIKLNSGTTEGTDLFTYDGSKPKTLNITPAIMVPPLVVILMMIDTLLNLK